MRDALARHAQRLGLPRVPEWVERTGSTNSDLKERARQGAPHGTALIAEEQHEGRGRLGRTWATLPGDGLALSVLLRPPLAAERAGLVGLAASVAVARVCGEAYRIKWPNDVLRPDDRKVAGILAEMEAEGPAVRWIVIGVGLNVTAAPDDVPQAGALLDGDQRDRAALAAALVRELLDTVDRLILVPGEVLGTWRTRSATLGRRVRVGDLEGLATGLAPDGALEITDDQGHTHRIVSGDVGVRK